MRKGTIFKYEAKRLLFSKEYLLLLAATAVYGVTLLRSIVLYGASYTAPFSPLTFVTFCSSLAPFLFTLLLVLCGRQLKASDKGAEAIIYATPMPPHSFRLLRYGAAGCAFLIAAALPVAACFVFYRMVFDYTAVGELFWLSLLYLLPPALLLFGAAAVMGGKKTAAVYVLLTAVLTVSVFQIPLPGFMDIAQSSADFKLTPAFTAGRAVFAGTGIALILASLYSPKKRRV